MTLGIAPLPALTGRSALSLSLSPLLLSAQGVELALGVSGSVGGAGQLLVFAKSRKAQVTEENMADLIFSATVSRSAAQSFSDAVSHVFAPLLLR
jgi:hypothetical protein